MNLTEQQSLVLFDIAKSAMNHKGGFAGYSNEDIMRLINEIILQQDNNNIIKIKKDRVIPNVPKSERSQMSEGSEEFWD